jgi:hypothetical protein
VAREVAILVVDRLDPRTIHGEQFASEKIEPPTKQHELTKYGSEGVTVIAPKIRDGLEVRLQHPQQPDEFDVAMTLRLQASTRPHPVQVAIDIELLEIAGA